jgi:hypothetical protein
MIREVGWVVGWLNILGQVAGLSSTEFGLSNMIWAAIVIAKDGNYQVTPGKVVGLFAALLIFHGILVRFCPFDGILSSVTGVVNAVPISHRTVLRRVISQHLQKDSFSSILALPLVRDSHHTAAPFSVLRSSIQSLLSFC